MSRLTVIFAAAFLVFLTLLWVTADSYWAVPQFRFFLFLLMNGALAGTILLSLPAGLALRQFLGIGYLLLVGVAHLWLGIAGLPRSGEFIILLWQFSAVMPFATLAHILRACVIQYPCTRTDLRFLLTDYDDVIHISAIIVGVSVVVIVAAVATASGRKVGNYIWMFLVSVSTVATLWMVVANAVIVRDGYSLYQDPWGTSILWSLAWPASCACAFWAAKAKTSP